MCILANIAKQYPQAAYAAFIISYQNEWAHRDKFVPVLLKVDLIGTESDNCYHMT